MTRRDNAKKRGPSFWNVNLTRFLGCSEVTVPKKFMEFTREHRSTFESVGFALFCVNLTQEGCLPEAPSGETISDTQIPAEPGNRLQSVNSPSSAACNCSKGPMFA